MANPNWVKGVSGNPKGAVKRPEIEELRKALARAKKLQGKAFLDVFIEKAYTDTACMIALAKKFLPDMRAEDITITSKTFADVVKDVMNARNARTRPPAG